MARPEGPESAVKVELGISQKLADYLDELKEMEGFGNSRPEIIRQFVWKEVHRLIEANRLKQK